MPQSVPKKHVALVFKFLKRLYALYIKACMYLYFFITMSTVFNV